MAPLDTLSVSQVELADHGQHGGCLRRWWLERVQGFRPDQTGAQTEGELGHELLAEYLRTGAMPPPRVKMSKMVTAAINKGRLPAPGSGLIEMRFDGQNKRDAGGRWIPVDRAKTFWLGGIPWDGFIDYQSLEPTDGVVIVLDHKFTSDLQYAKPAEDLIETVQMPVYCMVAAKRFQFCRVDGFWIVHHYVCRRGTSSTLRRAFVTLDQVLERRESILRVVERMKSVVQVEQQKDVPFSLKSCSAYMGCPHQARCRAFAGKDRVVPTYAELTDEEKALFPSMEEGALYAVSSDPKKVEPVKRASIIEDLDENEKPIAAGKDFGPPLAASEPAPVEKMSCADCGTVLDEGNSSRLQGGKVVHVNCPAMSQAAALSPEAEALAKAEMKVSPAEPVKRKPGRPRGSKNKPTEGQPQTANAITATARAQADETIRRIEAAESAPAAAAQSSGEAAPDLGCKTTADGGCMGWGCMHDAGNVPPHPTMTTSIIPANISITVDVGPVLAALLRKLAGV